MRLFAFAALLVLAAGCTMPSDSTSSSSTGPHVDASTYKVTVDFSGVDVQAGQNFTFGMHVDGTVSTESPHIGAHIWSSHQDSPSTSNAVVKCVHESAPRRVPNDFTVTCQAPAGTGTFYLRGHVQEVVGNTTVNWWSDEHVFATHP